MELVLNQERGKELTLDDGDFASKDPLFSTFSLILPTQTFSLGKAAKKQFLEMVYFVFLIKIHEGTFLIFQNISSQIW